MTSVLYRLGGACVRHRWIVLAVWLVVFLALAGWARSVGTNVNDNLTLPGSNSQRATNVLDAHFASQANGVIPVAMLAPAGTKITDSRFAKPIADTVKALKADPGVRGATSPLSSQGKSLLNKDKTIGYIALRLRLSPNQLTLDDANRIVDAAQPAKAAGLKPAFGGYLGQKVSKPDTHSSVIIGLAAAILVLLFTFGTAVAMALPITTAILGLVCGLSIVTLLSHVAEVPTVAPTLATMIGLGVGIDYALFIVTRHQAQRRGGMDTRESIARSVATSGGAILFAGTTVIIALCRWPWSASRSSPRWATPPRSSSRSRCARRSRCCRRCSRWSATGSTGSRCPTTTTRPTTIRTAGRAGAAPWRPGRGPASSARS